MPLYVIKAEDCFSPQACIYYNLKYCKKNFSSIKHTHSGFHEFMYIFEGEMRHFICGKDTTLTAGSGVIIREMDFHSITVKTSKSRCVYANVAFRKDILRDMARFLGYGYSFDYLEESKKISLKAGRFQQQTFEKELTEASDLFIKTGNEALLRAFILTLLLKQFPPGSEKGAGNITEDGPLWLKKACKLMQERNNFLKGVGILPDIIHKSPEHVSRVFQKYLHMTPSQYVNSLKLNHAAWLLQTTDETILTILLESGFDNAGYFHRLFKTHFNCTPKQYRNLKQRLIPG
jgi:AraC family cel operon transcriptional repressor